MIIGDPNLGFIPKKAAPPVEQGSWDISTAVYSGVSRSLIGSGRANQNDMNVSPDGLHMYSCYQDGYLAHWIMSVAWDISTLSFVGETSFAAKTYGSAISTDGTRLLINDQTSTSVMQFDLTTPFDLNTAVYSTARVHDYTNTTAGFSVNKYGAEAGNYVILCNYNWDWMFIWKNTTPWAVMPSAPRIAGENVPEVALACGSSFSTEGTRLFLADRGSRTVHQWNLSTPFDWSSKTYIGSKYLIDVPASLRGLNFTEDGKTLLVVDSANKRVFEYHLT